MLVLDLRAASRGDGKDPTLRSAALWTCAWSGLALVFGLAVYLLHGGEAAVAYLTAYVVEESLSIDNIFVFVLIFSELRTPAAQQRKVLYWGIVGAVFLRAVLIASGMYLLDRFQWITYIFAAVIVLAAAPVEEPVVVLELDPRGGEDVEVGRRLELVARHEVERDLAGARVVQARRLLGADLVHRQVVRERLAERPHVGVDEVVPAAVGRAGVLQLGRRLLLLTRLVLLRLVQVPVAQVQPQREQVQRLERMRHLPPRALLVDAAEDGVHRAVCDRSAHASFLPRGPIRPGATPFVGHYSGLPRFDAVSARGTPWRCPSASASASSTRWSRPGWAAAWPGPSSRRRCPAPAASGPWGSCPIRTRSRPS